VIVSLSLIDTESLQPDPVTIKGMRIGAHLPSDITDDELFQLGASVCAVIGTALEMFWKDRQSDLGLEPEGEGLFA